MHKYPDLPAAFAELGIETPFLRALHKVGFVQPSEIQRQLIPPALKGHDLLGQARTGTGKTAAFALPVLQRIDPAGRLQAVCLAPTRELAVQVCGEVKRLAEFTSLHIVSVYGGQKVATQLHQLGRKPHFVIGTPGRILDFIGRKVLDMSSVRFAILDEVDRMLDIGFRDDIRDILSRMTAPHQTIFVSATIDAEINSLARKFMKEPLEINVSQDRLTVEEVNQSFVTVDRHDKFRLLRTILQLYDPPICIVFCNTKHAARKLAKKLYDAGVNAMEIHGDLVQQKRDRVMERFRRHQLRVLVATDLASRGIDVSAISHIINYDIPMDSLSYVHRIGRTGRMGARGTAITFVTRDEGKELTSIEKLINCEISRLEVEGFDASPLSPGPEDRFESASEQMDRTAAVSVAVAPPPPKAAPRTLGSRFPVSRRRRRL